MESEEVKRPCVAATKGNGAEQTVWRMMVRNGAALEKERGAVKQAVAQVVKDFKKFYESISHADVKDGLKKHNFSQTLARATTGDYAMKRRICIKDVYSEELWPGAGVVAGCSFDKSFLCRSP